MKNLAMWITVSRLPLTVFMLILFYQNTRSSYQLALIFFMLAVLSDILDGYVARKFDQVSKIGSQLDALLDKIMVHSMIFSLFYAGVYSPAVVFAMFFRDMIVDGLRNYVYETSGISTSNIWGKTKFACQAASIALGLIYCTEPQDIFLSWLANATLILGFVLSLPGLYKIVVTATHATVIDRKRLHSATAIAGV
jgi:CDP-diacylglycerol--glycerol-3-phosphate 3-phosphatidyltransferase